MNRRQSRPANGGFTQADVQQNGLKISAFKEPAVEQHDSESLEEVYFVDARCQISQIPSYVRRAKSVASNRKQLKSSFSTQRLIRMQDQFLDAAKIKTYNIQDYDAEVSRLRWKQIKRQFKANELNRQKAASADEFGALQQLRRRLIRK